MTTEVTYTQIRNTLLGTDSSQSRTIRQHLRDGQLVRISRGIFMPRKIMESTEKPWMQERCIHLARIAAAAELLGHERAFVRESAALIHGYDLLSPSGNVHLDVSGGHTRLRTTFPQVITPSGTVVPTSRVRTHLTTNPYNTVERIHGLGVVSAEHIMMDLARYAHSKKAVANISSILHELAVQHSADAQERSAYIRRLKAQMMDTLEASPSSRGKRRGIEIFQFSSHLCESVAEGVFLWILAVLGSEAHTLQCPVKAQEQYLRADVALRAQGVLIEIDGLQKTQGFDVATQEGHRALLERSRLLQEAGWRMLHFPAAQVLYRSQEVIRQLRSYGPEFFPGAKPKAWAVRDAYRDQARGWRQ